MLNRCIISHTAYGPALTHKNRKCTPKRCAGFRHFGEVNYSYPRPVVHCEFVKINNTDNIQESFIRAIQQGQWITLTKFSWYEKHLIVITSTYYLLLSACPRQNLKEIGSPPATRQALVCLCCRHSLGGLYRGSRRQRDSTRLHVQLDTGSKVPYGICEWGISFYLFVMLCGHFDKNTRLVENLWLPRGISWLYPLTFN